MLPAFAEAADLRVRLGLAQMTAAQTAQADALLGDASSLIRSTLGLSITSVDDDTVLLPAPAGNELRLPEIPATAPSAVRVNGQLVTDWTFDGRRLLTRAAGWQAWDSSGALLRVEVTYTHGYAEVPDEIVRVCCQAAARAFYNPSGVIRSEPKGDFSVGYDTTTPGVYLTDGEIKALRKAVGLPLAKSFVLT